MTTFEVSLVTAVVAAILAAVGTYATARRDLQLKFDSSLRDLRIDAYKELWAALELLAKYSRPAALSTDDAIGLSKRLRTWYFETGGLFLSDSMRQDYFAMQDGLQLVISGSAGTLSDENDEYLRALGSRLRTAMTRDVGTRRTFVFRGDPERNEPPPEPRAYVDLGGQRRLEIAATRSASLVRRLRFLPWGAASGWPELTLDGGKLVAWDRGRQAMTVRLTTGPGPAEDRLILVEKGYLVDGPKGWRRGEVARRAPSVIWNAADSPPAVAADPADVQVEHASGESE